MSLLTFPDSLWAATASLAPRCPPLEEERQVDVCIVGAGFTGLSAALHLGDSGAEVAVLEAAQPGWGASGRNGGQVIPGLRLDPIELEQRFGAKQGATMTSLAGDAPALVFDLIERHAIDCHAERSGWIQAIHSPRLLGAAESRARQWRERDVEVDVLDRQQTANLLGSSGYVGALLDRRGGKLQPLSYARGLAHAAQRAGTVIYGDSPARRLVKQEKGWRVETDQGRLIAGQVLLCTNGYTDRLWPKLARSVVPLFSYRIATVPLPQDARRTILPHGHVSSDTRRLIRYFRTDHRGRLLVGGRGQFTDSSAPELYWQVLTAMRELFPSLQDLEVEFYWAGKVAITTDHLPHLHELSPGVYAALGYNGRGVAMATALGRVLAARASGEDGGVPEFPVTPLDTVPLHLLRQPILRGLYGWKSWRDEMEARRAQAS